MKTHPAFVVVPKSPKPISVTDLPAFFQSLLNGSVLGRILFATAFKPATLEVVEQRDYLAELHKLSEFPAYTSAPTHDHDEPLFTRGRWKRVVEHKVFGLGTPLHRKTLDGGLAVVVVQYGDLERTLVIDADHWVTPIDTLLRVKMQRVKPASIGPNEDRVTDRPLEWFTWLTAARASSPDIKPATPQVNQFVDDLAQKLGLSAAWRQDVVCPLPQRLLSKHLPMMAPLPAADRPRTIDERIADNAEANNVVGSELIEYSCFAVSLEELRAAKMHRTHGPDTWQEWSSYADFKPPLNDRSVKTKKQDDIWCATCVDYVEQAHECTIAFDSHLALWQYYKIKRGQWNADSIYRAYLKRREQDRLYRVAAFERWPSFRALCSELWDESTVRLSRMRVSCGKWASAPESPASSQKQFEYDLFMPNRLLEPQAVVAISDSMQEADGNPINTFGQVNGDFDGESDHCIKDRRSDAIWFARRTRSERYIGYMKLVCERCGSAFWNRKGTKYCNVDTCK